MLLKLSQWLILIFFTEIHDEDERLLCIYGCEQLLYTAVSTLGLLIQGVLMNAGVESILIIIIFYLCQSRGGGFHASSHIKCFFTMAIGLFIGLFMLQIPIIQLILPYIGLISSIILYKVPLCLHPNKQYLRQNIHQLKVCSYFTTTEVLLFLILMMLSGFKHFFQAGCMAMLLSAISRLYAAKKQKGQLTSRVS